MIETNVARGGAARKKSSPRLPASPVNRWLVGWGMLAYTVGFGGSMIWFGSAAGVALSNMYPEAKSVARWLYHGWHVTLAYVLGFFVLLGVLGWQPTRKRGDPPTVPAASSAPAGSAAGAATVPTPSR